MPKNGRSVFEGDAVAAAASITRYKERDVTGTVPAQATCSLPGIGGTVEQVVKGFTRHRFAHFLSFERAKVAAEGKQAAAQMAAAAGKSSSTTAAPRSLQASVSATVKRASVAGRFEAREVHADGRLGSSKGGEEGPITWAGSYLKGVKLDGYRVDVEFEPDAIRPRSGSSYSIVRSIQTDHPDAVIDPAIPNVIQVPDFGTVVIGEVLASNDTQRLTLLRFELSGSDSGSAELCEVQIGSRSVDPPRRRAPAKGGRPVVMRVVDDGLSGIPV